MPNSHYETIDSNKLQPSDKESFELLNSWLTRMMKADLKDSWKKAEVDIKLPPIQPRSAKILKRKKKDKEGTSSFASADKEVVVMDRIAISEGKKVANSSKNLHVHSSPIEQTGLTVGAGTPSPPPPPPETKSKRAWVSQDAPDPDAELQRLKEAAEERLRERGPMPSIADLEACQRVITTGLSLFRELSGELSSQVAQRLRGKIASHTAENAYFESRLARVQVELDSQRDKCFFYLSEENRALKEELEKLQLLQQRLDAANNKVVEQKKHLEKLPKAEQERDEAHRSTLEAEDKAKRLRTRVEEFSRANEEAEVWYGMATAEGF